MRRQVACENPQSFQSAEVFYSISFRSTVTILNAYSLVYCRERTKWVFFSDFCNLRRFENQFQVNYKSDQVILMFPYVCRS